MSRNIEYSLPDAEFNRLAKRGEALGLSGHQIAKALMRLADNVSNDEIREVVRAHRREKKGKQRKGVV